MNSRQYGSVDSYQIVLDSAEAVDLGFLSARFDGHLMREGETIYIWRIRSKEPGRGHLSALVQRMLDAGYTVKVPTPIGRMAEIVRHKGFRRTVEYDPEIQPYEVWVKEPGPAFTPFPSTSTQVDGQVKTGLGRT